MNEIYVHTYPHVHTYLHTEDGKEKNLFVLGSLMSLCVFINSEACPWRANLQWGHINYRTQLLLVQVHKPADTLVPSDSWYTPINPSVQNKVSVLTQCEGKWGHVECDSTTEWLSCMWVENMKESWTVICSLPKLVNSLGENSILLLWRFLERWCEKERALCMSPAISLTKRNKSFFTFPLASFTWSTPHICLPTKAAPLYFWLWKCSSAFFYFCFFFFFLNHISLCAYS